MTPLCLYLDFKTKLFELHQEFQFSETSGWRTAKRNKRVGGHPASKHLSGLGIDCVLDDPRHTGAFTKAVRAKGLSFLNEGDHLHVQVRKGT